MKLKPTTKKLLLELGDEIKKYNFEDYQDVVYECVKLLINQFSDAVQTRICQLFHVKF